MGPFYAPITPPKWVRFARQSPAMTKAFLLRPTHTPVATPRNMYSRFPSVAMTAIPLVQLRITHFHSPISFYPVQCRTEYMAHRTDCLSTTERPQSSFPNGLSQ
ncbi:hypothetical protein Pan161_04070 [Gimesia algae]|uniref:Uncharacterized protein n=1 Tax=Gimesia algae TaxID=2527971 RepID=A0A517V708_9PLAN|nr:hypothetical protein Pan161_04070 [Gimesia algae]